MSYYYPERRGFFSSLPVVTKNILIINIFMLLFTYLRERFMVGTFALYYPGSPMFHWWQPVTHMFMHGNFFHLFFNMFAFVMFGSALERQWGPKKYLAFYFITGLGAAALHLGVMWIQIYHFTGQIVEGGQQAAMAMYNISVIKSTPMVGASGAIYGILMGYAMLYPDTRLTLLFPPITLTARKWVIIWFVIELFTGVFSMGGGVAHFAHLGGMLFGYLLIRMWKKRGTMYQYEE